MADHFYSLESLLRLHDVRMRGNPWWLSNMADEDNQ